MDEQVELTIELLRLLHVRVYALHFDHKQKQQQSAPDYKAECEKDTDIIQDSLELLLVLLLSQGHRHKQGKDK